MTKITLPTSDVVSVQHPFRLQIESAGAAEVTVVLRHETLRTEQTATCPLNEAGASLLVIEASALAEGEYAGTVRVVEDGQVTEQAFPLFRLADTVCPTPDFGMYAIPGKPEELDWVFENLQKMGVTLIQEHTWGLSQISGLVDKAARYGMRFQPSLRYWREDLSLAEYAEAENVRMVRHDAEAELHAQENVPYEMSLKSPCLNHPKLRAWARANTAEYLKEYRSHPSFSGKVYFGDDLFLNSLIQQGKANLACTCVHCRDDYRKRTGNEVPMPPEILRGVVAPDHPWLVWMRYRCVTQYGDFVRQIEAARTEVDAGIEVGLCHGFPDNPFVSLAHGLYGPQTQPGSVVSSYCYPFLRSPCADFIAHYEIARMGNRDKPVWMLGVCGADRVAVPGWHVRQNYWNMLAAGYDLMAFFSWHDYYGLLTGGAWKDCDWIESNDAIMEDGIRRTHESMAAVAQCGAHKDWVLPAAKHWERPKAKAAVLYSFTTEAFDVAPEYRGILHSKKICEFYRECLRRHVEVEVICEEEVRAGKLSEYDALCLPDARVLPGDVKVTIDEFAVAGGRLFTAPDYLYTDSWHPNMKVAFEGMTEMDPDTMAMVLAQEQGAVAECDNGDVTLRRFYSGDVEYYVVVNNYADRYHGMTYVYGNPQADYDRADRVRDEAVTTTLTLGKPGRTLVDLTSGEIVGRTGETIAVELEPSWGRVYAALPTEKAELNLEVPETASLAENMSLKLSFNDENDSIVCGSFTARVTVTSPSGRTLSSLSWVDIEGGERVFSVPFAANEETGTWIVTAEGGFPRRTLTHQVAVAGCSAEFLTLSLEA